MPITSLVPVDSRNTLAIQSPNTVAIPPRFPVANIDNSPHQISSRFKTQERQETFSTSNDNSNTSTLKSSAFTTAVSGTFNPGRALAPLPPSIAKNVVLLSQRWSDVEAMITKSEYQPQAKNYPLIVARINVVRQSLQNQDGVEQALATINKTASSRLQNITSLENKLPKAEISLLQSVLENGFIPTLMRVRNDNGWQELAKDTALNTLHSLCTSEERLSVILPLSELAGLERTLDAAEQLNHLDSISKMSGEIRKKTNGNEGAIKLPETMRTFGMKVDTLAAGHEATVETEFRTIRNTLKPIAGFFDRIINTKENESSEFPENIQAPHFKGTRNFAALLQLSHQENQAQLRSRMKELKARSQELCCMDYTRAVKAEIRRTESQLNEITQKLDRIAPNPLRELSLAPSGKFEEIFRETINSNINRMQETLEACGFFSALDRSTTKISDADLLKFLHQDGNALHAEMQTFQAKQKRVAEADNCGVRHLNAIEHSLAEYKENSAKEDELKVMRHQPSQGELDWLHRQEIHYFARDSILRDMIAQDERDNLPIYIICEDSHTQKVRTIGQQLDGNGEHVTNDVTELRTQRFAVKVTLKEYANLKTQEQQRQFVGSLVGFEPATDAVFKTVWVGDKDAPQGGDGILIRKIYAEATEFNREIEFKAHTNTNLPFQKEGFNLEKAVSDALINNQPLKSTWYHSGAEPLPLTDYPWSPTNPQGRQNTHIPYTSSEVEGLPLSEVNNPLVSVQTSTVEIASAQILQPELSRHNNFHIPEILRPDLQNHLGMTAGTQQSSYLSHEKLQSMQMPVNNERPTALQKNETVELAKLSISRATAGITDKSEKIHNKIIIIEPTPSYEIEVPVDNVIISKDNPKIASIDLGDYSQPVRYDGDLKVWRIIASGQHTRGKHDYELGNPVWLENNEWRSGSFEELKKANAEGRIQQPMNWLKVKTPAGLPSLPDVGSTQPLQDFRQYWGGDNMMPASNLKNIIDNARKTMGFSTTLYLDVPDKIFTKMNDVLSPHGVKLTNIRDEAWFEKFEATPAGRIYNKAVRGENSVGSVASDIIRKVIINQHGGVYLDNDNRIMKKIPIGKQLIAGPNDILLGAHVEKGTVRKGYPFHTFASHSNNPVLTEMIESININAQDAKYKDLFDQPRPFREGNSYYKRVGDQKVTIEASEFHSWVDKIYNLAASAHSSSVLEKCRPDYFTFGMSDNFEDTVVGSFKSFHPEKTYNHYFPFDREFPVKSDFDNSWATENTSMNDNGFNFVPFDDGSESEGESNDDWSNDNFSDGGLQ